MERRLTENIHHVYFDKRSWNSQTLSSRIRNLDQSQIVLPIEIHNELHANTLPMPIPSAAVARSGLERILSRPRSYSPLDVVLDSEEYFRSMGSPIADRLAEQIPYIEMGVNSLKRRFVA